MKSNCDNINSIDDIDNVFGEKDIPDRQNAIRYGAKRFEENAKKLKELIQKKNKSKSNIITKLINYIANSDNNTSANTSANNSSDNTLDNSSDDGDIPKQELFRCIRYGIISITIYKIVNIICNTFTKIMLE
jgi:hypothetical protein